MLNDADVNLTAIENLSGASSLIIDALHDETAMRRALILGNVNTSMKDVLSTTVPDEFLFGKDLSELLKQALTTHKDIQVLSKKSVAPTSNGTKNLKGPQRPTGRSQTTTTSGQQRSTPAYINRMGGTRYEYLNKITRDKWQWCEAHNNIVFASFIKSKENVEADEESRREEAEDEYELSNEAYENIVKSFGHPQIDLVE
ncbi:hypothetical protein TKK_0000424 [Trichogramma kaykai]|uniref:Uncharacterized protein n=1 Tax=Trichogramma kaykai TaxID=54128 RepID=A0ABD2VXI7_9HYME